MKQLPELKQAQEKLLELSFIEMSIIHNLENLSIQFFFTSIFEFSLKATLSCFDISTIKAIKIEPSENQCIIYFK